MKFHWLTVLSLALLFSCLVLAQGTGSISGVVQDESGAVVPGASVAVTNVGTGIGSSFVTDATGGYHFPSLNPGIYEVRAQISGFETGIRRGVQLTVGSDLEINIPLKVGQVAQQTVVTAEAPIVNTLNSSVGALVDAPTIRELPLNGRSFDQLISLDSSTPTFRSRGRSAAYGQGDLYTVNGAGTASNLYLIDGTEMQGAGTGFALPGGVLGKNLGVDAIQEFVVLSSNYSAGYGKKGGGIINIATRSGTNQLHGSAYEFLRNNDLDARNFFDPHTVPRFQRNEFGGSLGGPIKKDHSFFFGNYEGLRENLGISKVSVVPNALAHQGFLPDPNNPGQLVNIGVATAIKPFLETLFPLPNGQDFGDGSAAFISSPAQINNLDYFLVRFDQKLSDKDFFFARYNFDQASQTSPDPTSASPLFFNASGNRDQIVTLEEKRLFSPRTINLLRFGFSRGFVHTTSSTYTPLPASLNFTPGADTVGQINFSASLNSVAQQGLSRSGSGMTKNAAFAQNLFEVADQVFRYIGKHSLQFGIQMQRNQANDGSGDPPRGAYTFTGGLTAFLQGKPNQFSGVPSLPGTFDKHKSYRRNYFSTFVQDDYKVFRNLTLNLGLRYELLTVPVEASGNRISNYGYTFVNGARILNALPTLGSPMYQGNHLNLAPRFGFAWDPRGDGKMSVRGGFGVFYDQDLQANHFYLATNAPFATTYTVINPIFGNPFAGGASPPLPSSQTLDPAWKTPTRLQYSLGIQRQITSSSVLNIGFVGAHSYHTGRLSNANTFVPTLQGGVIFYPASGQPRLQPALSGTSSFVTTDANASYNALQTEFTQRLNQGMRYKVSYTYSKNLALSSGNIASYSNGELGVTQNPYNARAEWGPSPFNLKHNLTANYTYDIPWGGTSGLSGKLLGGWQVGGIVTVHPGTPFTVTDGFNRSRDGDTTAPDRPNLALGANGVTILGGPNRYFDSSVFVLPPPGFFGNVGRNTLNGPGFAAVDFNLSKTTSVNERLKVEFRTEFFNILNHANFDLPSGQIFDSTGRYLGSAGHVSATITTSRQIQLGLKLIF
jgi:hypothetical protein